jgi:hypothetical protein
VEGLPSDVLGCGNGSDLVGWKTNGVHSKGLVRENLKGNLRDMAERYRDKDYLTKNKQNKSKRNTKMDSNSMY